ncbi:hypothetical protein [Achromobacter aloeverae]
MTQLKKNSHLQEYLQYYLSVEKPGYAVLVTGPWGTGKTYQVRRAVQEDCSLYISLYGVPSVEQLHTEVVAAAYPNVQRASKAAELVKGLGGVGALAGGAANLLGTYLRKELEPEKTLIFDDLERSRIPLEDLLGAINSYVEHRGFRTIVIAHDGKVADAFLAMREKTFGQVIAIEPEVRQAFEHFLIQCLSSGAQDFIRRHGERILGVFAQSGHESLRILRHVVMDLGRLHDVLSPIHLQHGAAMEHLVSLFVAFDVEVRGGALGIADLINRVNATISYRINSLTSRDQQPTSPLMSADEKYSGIDLTSDNMLNDEVLEQIFIEGRYDRASILQSLNNSSYFIKPSEVPAWKVMINFDELDDAVVEAAVKKMNEEFDARTITEPGAILHIFGLRLMMAEECVSGRSLSDEVEAGKAYIDDLLSADSLPPRGTEWRWQSSLDHGHDGFGFWVTPTGRPFFDELRSYLFRAREEALRRRFPALVQELIEKARTDPQAAFDMLSKRSATSYASIPILRDADAASVVEAWLSAPREQWRTLQSAFDDRYGQGQLQRELEEELRFSRALREALELRANETSGLSRFRIKRIVPKALIALSEPASSN